MEYDIGRAIRRFPDQRDELTRSAEKASKLRHACGCAMGAACFVATTLAFVAMLISRPPGWAGLPLRIGAGVLAALLATAFGKVAGIAFARLRLAWLVRGLQRRYPVEDRHDDHLHPLGR
ncbi:hypothetical protein [Paraburkholderia caballeronis]|uniref:hypothetical protein n=1 Tax=Paraburkholderia caballeronis TaxID=416943 RepID=UPI0010660936|nr:hypothetical protein [Paraburkholderia caballeronis]TDV19580.1 hypothetical protein C7408_102325 [Paraburkholderia caballeronis]TDV22180.1 hypothetical protein C7406_101325 [Paraburkholderia caballeronis]TDV29084.1 hypothetical protein C7404_102326 [Paraburkholderia caballeronis]